MFKPFNTHLGLDYPGLLTQVPPFNFLFGHRNTFVNVHEDFLVQTLSRAEPKRCNVDVLLLGTAVVSMIAAPLVVIIGESCLLYYSQEHDKN